MPKGVPRDERMLMMKKKEELAALEDRLVRRNRTAFAYLGAAFMKAKGMELDKIVDGINHISDIENAIEYIKFLESEDRNNV